MTEKKHTVLARLSKFVFFFFKEIISKGFECVRANISF